MRRSTGLISNVCMIDHLGRNLRWCGSHHGLCRKNLSEEWQDIEVALPILECGFSEACFLLPKAPKRAGVYSLTIRVKNLSLLCVDMSRVMHANSMVNHTITYCPCWPALHPLACAQGVQPFWRSRLASIENTQEGPFLLTSPETSEFCCQLPCPVC